MSNLPSLSLPTVFVHRKLPQVSVHLGTIQCDDKIATIAMLLLANDRMVILEVRLGATHDLALHC